MTFFSPLACPWTIKFAVDLSSCVRQKPKNKESVDRFRLLKYLEKVGQRLAPESLSFPHNLRFEQAQPRI